MDKKLNKLTKLTKLNIILIIDTILINNLIALITIMPILMGIDTLDLTTSNSITFLVMTLLWSIHRLMV